MVGYSFPGALYTFPTDGPLRYFLIYDKQAAIKSDNGMAPPTKDNNVSYAPSLHGTFVVPQSSADPDVYGVDVWSGPQRNDQLVEGNQVDYIDAEGSTPCSI